MSSKCHHPTAETNTTLVFSDLIGKYALCSVNRKSNHIPLLKIQQ